MPSSEFEFPFATFALGKYEELLVEHDADVVRRLRPGLTREEAERVAERNGVFLDDDALALWMWHDGDALADSEANGWHGLPGIAAGLSFPSLADALTLARRVQSGDAYRHWADLNGMDMIPPLDAAPEVIAKSAREISQFFLPVATLMGEPVISLQCIRPEKASMIEFGIYLGSVDRDLRDTHRWIFTDMLLEWLHNVKSGYWLVYPDGQLRTNQYWGLSGHDGEQEVKEKFAPFKFETKNGVYTREANERFRAGFKRDAEYIDEFEREYVLKRRKQSDGA